MLISIHFFAYDDPGRQHFHSLNTQVSVSSLAGFHYGQRFILSEATTGSSPQSYRMAALPVQRRQPAFFQNSPQSVDIYLATEEQWPEFAPLFAEVDTRNAGTGVFSPAGVYAHRLLWTSNFLVTV